MEYAIQVHGLCKNYKDFSLQNVTLNVPIGSIVGFVGENGAGKTTTLKAILGAIRIDGGAVEVLGGSAQDKAVRAQIGIVFEDAFFYETMTPLQVGKSLAGMQPAFDRQHYAELLARFDLPDKKVIKDMSRGMRMKLRLAAALAHRPRLLLLDEATSGLDPVMRGEILDMLRDYIQDEAHSVLISSHITSDLEKIADSIVYIQRGKVLFQMDKDRLLEEYGVVRCSADELSRLPAGLVVAKRKGAFAMEALVKDRAEANLWLRGAVVDKASVEDIMQFYAGRETK
ncbi:ABC transporter ATP-binding protein [Allofournierella sp.]|uniref:ABC transporter ATP-binding protein n=1 Tax=Allofournierella sp. TaxID=1940256 RepID=UPI003AEF4B6C